MNKTALFKAIEKENIEIIKLLLNNSKIDVNILSILIIFRFYEILNHAFQFNLKSYISMSFKNYVF